MSKNLQARIQTKRDSSLNWEVNNPVLLNGEEILVDTDAGEVRKKVGDGTKKYNELPFIDQPLKDQITTLETEMQQVKKSVSDGKTLVAAAITRKNIATDSTASFTQMADNIDKLRSYDKYYRVQCGAYSSYNNAKILADKLKAAGFDCYITYPIT